MVFKISGQSDFIFCWSSHPKLFSNSKIFSVQQFQWPHGLRLLLWTEPALPGTCRALWSLWENFQLHQQEENLCWLLQHLLLLLSSNQGGQMFSLWSSQPETSAQGGTDEAEGEGPPAFPHQEEDQHQVLRRWDPDLVTVGLYSNSSLSLLLFPSKW